MQLSHHPRRSTYEPTACRPPLAYSRSASLSQLAWSARSSCSVAPVLTHFVAHATEAKANARTATRWMIFITHPLLVAQGRDAAPCPFSTALGKCGGFERGR